MNVKDRNDIKNIIKVKIKKYLKDSNLEENIKIETVKGEKIEREVMEYFERLLEPQYTTPYIYEKQGIIKHIIYRLQEWSGMSTF